jgi:threonine dehydrogenase-like Zn-dependent dehydrogenase
MKVAKLYSFNDIRIEDIPVPKIGPGDALIKTKASGICSGDVMPWYIEKKAPLVLGHEPAGEIVELGSSLVRHPSSFSVGDRVFAHHHAPCLVCRYCSRGDHVQCETWKNTKIIPGGISEYILIPEINLKNDTLKLPDNVSFEDGTLVEPTACVLKGLKRSGLKFENSSPLDTPHPNPFLRGERYITPPIPARRTAGGLPLYKGRSKEGLLSPSFDGNPPHHFPSLDGRGAGEGDKLLSSFVSPSILNISFSEKTVLVIGLGVMGQLNILIAKRFGAGRIIGADMIQYRLMKAKEFGANDVIDVSKESLVDSLRRLTDGEMADLVVVGPNSVEAMREGILAAGAGGTVLFFTPAKPGEKLTIDPNHLYFNDINIVTSYSCGPSDTAEALKLIEEGVIRAEKLVTHRFPIEKTYEAFRLVAEAKESLKVVITFE